MSANSQNANVKYRFNYLEIKNLGGLGILINIYG